MAAPFFRRFFRSLFSTPVGLLAVGLLLAGWLALPESPRRDPGAAPAELSATVGPDALARAQARIARQADKLRRRAARGPANPGEAAAHDLLQRRPLDGGDIPLEKLLAAREQIRQREQAGQRAASGAAPSWIELGPGNVGGRTRAIAIDPQNPDTLYAAGVSGGVWKSLDGGANWFALDDLMLNLAVSTLVIDATDPDTLYAGTGEGFLAGGTYKRGLGIFKSVDAGATWFQLPGTVQGVPAGAFYYVNKIAISPNDPQRLYAGTRTGVWRSLDGGQNWSVVLMNPEYLSGPFPSSSGCPAGCTDVVVRNDRDPDVLFAAFGVQQSDGLYRSVDGGDSWLAYTVPSVQGRMTLALAPSDNDVVYLGMAGNLSGTYGSLVNVYRSIDGGDNWEGRVDFDTLTGPWLLGNLLFGGGCSDNYYGYHQGWHDQALAVDPADPDIVWVGGIDLFRSDDGGRNFGIASYWFFDQQDELTEPLLVHADQHTVVFHPDYDGTANQIMYVGNDGGLYRTANARAATSQEDCPLPPDEPLPAIEWEDINSGYGTTQFYHGDSAQDGDGFFGGSQDNGVNGVYSAGMPNDWQRLIIGDGGYVAVDPTNGQTLYANVQFFPTIRKSTDGGETFEEVIDGITDEDGLFISPFVMDPSDPDVLWTGGSRPWRTTDGAQQWTLAGSDFAGPDKISGLAVAPTDGNVVYLGFSNGYVARTANGLAPSPGWTVFGSSSGLILGGYISSVAVDPEDPDVAYCTYSNYGIPHVYRTLDGGTSWASIDGISFSGIPDIPAHWIAVRPGAPHELYVGTELGVFASVNSGLHWAPFNGGLAHVVVETLDFQSSSKLVAYTHGRGAFRVDLPPPQGGDPIPAASTWSLAILVALLLAAGRTVIARRVR